MITEQEKQRFQVGCVGRKSIPPLQTKKLFLPEAQNLFCLCCQDSDLMKGRMADFLLLLLLNCFIRYSISFLPHVQEIICLY